MNSSPALDSLEIAIIELEYAAADFSQWKALITEPQQLYDWEALISKSVKANRALHIAIGSLGRETPNNSSHGVPAKRTASALG